MEEGEVDGAGEDGTEKEVAEEGRTKEEERERDKKGGSSANVGW